MFVNEKKYLVLSNFSDSPYELKLRENWTDRVSGIASTTFTIQSKNMIFLQQNEP